MDEWDKLLAEPGRKDEFDFIDCSPILSSAMASKDEDELVRHVSLLLDPDLHVMRPETRPHGLTSGIRALGPLLHPEIGDNS